MSATSGTETFVSEAESCKWGLKKIVEGSMQEDGQVAYTSLVLTNAEYCTSGGKMDVTMLTALFYRNCDHLGM